MVNGVHLSTSAAAILRRGGHDSVSDDQMLLMELANRAPGMSQDDLRKCFIVCRMEYGDDALRAVRGGHVQFAKREGVK